MPTFSLTDITFWLHMLQYFLAVGIGYYIPGSVILNKISLPRIFHATVSIVLGMVLFAYQGYVFGYFHVRFLSYVYLLVFVALWLRQYISRKRTYQRSEYHIDKKTLLIIIIGSFCQLTTIWFSGITYGKDAYYCCGDANDNFLYGTLSREIVYNIPPEHPGMVGEVFKNYHYWSNIVVGETSRVFVLPVYQVQFQYSVLLMPAITGLLLLCVTYLMNGSVSLGWWVLFFFYFGSDAIYWLILLLKSAPMFSMSSLEDGVGYLANYPRAIAFICALCGMIFLFLVRKKPSFSLVIVTSLVLAGIAGMKIYVGVFIYSGLICLALYDLIKHRSWITSIVGVCTLIFLLPTYLLSNVGAGGLYYAGFWRVQNFIVQPRLNLLRLEQARIIYEADNKWFQVMCYNLLFTGMYILAIFGTKMISILNSKASLKQVNTQLHFLLIPAIIISFVIGLFYNQQTGESNTFNFLVTAFIFLSFYAALAMNYLSTKNKTIFGKLIVLLVILLTIPRSLYRTYTNIGNIIQKRGHVISKGVLDVSRVIRSETRRSDIILIDSRSFPFDMNGPVFSMLLDRPMYFSGENFLYWFKTPKERILERKSITKTIFTSPDIIQVAAALKETPINYLIVKNYSFTEATRTAVFLETLYTNADIQVLRVLPNSIPLSVLEDRDESTKASTVRYNQMILPYLAQ